jgi:Kef-type K+ transport system membrane component KefB
MGFMHAARLSLIIAAVEIARNLDYIDEVLYTSFILLALASAVVGPTIAKSLMGKGERPETVCTDEDYMYGV